MMFAEIWVGLPGASLMQSVRPEILCRQDLFFLWEVFFGGGGGQGVRAVSLRGKKGIGGERGGDEHISQPPVGRDWDRCSRRW